MLYDHISSNKRKSIFLIALFFVIIGALGYALGAYVGNIFIGLFFAIIFSVIMTLISFYSGDKMILSMSHA
ncbi:zinc metalloprotease HtpX, partial [Candidatus Woesearchaeota archaeon]|nr:zinc metalloprotease HtpX [Candidatus Woesearchaeota archaeon]